MTTGTKVAEEQDVKVAPTRAPESIPTRPTRKQTIDAIVAEIGCTHQAAADVIDYVHSFVQRARAGKYAKVYPSEYELAETAYDTMDLIMPHGQTAVPGSGSAHDVLSRHLLKPDRDEFSLVHDMRNEFGEQRLYCTVTVSLATLN